MKILSRPECEEFAAGLSAHFRRNWITARINSLKHVASFVYDGPLAYATAWQPAGAVAVHLVSHLGRYTQALLWIYAYPFWWDRSREEHPPATWEQFLRWRSAHGESRSPHDMPGHLFETNEAEELVGALGTAIATQCELVLVTRPFRDLFVHNDGDLIMVQSRHNLSVLSSKLIRLGLSRCNND